MKILLFFIVVIVAAFLGIAATVFFLPTQEADEFIPPATEPNVEPPTAPPPIPQAMVEIFLIALEDAGQLGKLVGCDDSVVSVTVAAPDPSVSSLKNSLDALFSLKEATYGASKLYNTLAQSEIRVERADVVDGIAEVALVGTIRSGGVCDDPRIDAQIRETARQFPEVNDVVIILNGSQEAYDDLFNLRGE